MAVGRLLQKCRDGIGELREAGQSGQYLRTRQTNERRHALPTKPPIGRFPALACRLPGDESEATIPDAVKGRLIEAEDRLAELSDATVLVYRNGVLKKGPPSKTSNACPL